MNLFWKEIRVQWTTAILLAMIAGYVDGYGLFFLGNYVSFMSGNTTGTGLRIGQGHFHAAFPSAIAILFFVTGSFFANLLSQSRSRHSHRMIFSLVASGLATVTALEWGGLQNISLEIALLCLTMGMMNPALSKVGAESVSLTFVTGTLNRIGGHLASAAGRKPLQGALQGDSHITRAGIEASIWCGFLSGAVLSGIAGSDLRTWALLPACAVLIALGLFRDFLIPLAAKRTVSAATTIGAVARD